VKVIKTSKIKSIAMVIFTMILSIQVTAQTYNNWLRPSGQNYIYNVNTGNVGIGTTNPGGAYKLDISAGSSKVRIYSSDDAPLLLQGSDNWSGIEFRDNGPTTDFIWYRGSNATFSIGGDGANVAGKKLHIEGGTSIGSTYRDNAAPSNGLIVSGYVGIGTTNPSSALCVNGTIRAREVIVTTQGWPDHVLKHDYNLKPLHEVEKYIKKNSHLEGIPSEKEIKANGIPMGEMQAKLLQKLEETTLYLIEMKKENERLKARLTAIEQKVK
jgi:hypothetical protein